MIRRLLSKFHWEDAEFVDDVRHATLRGAHPMANLLLWVMAAFFGLFILWANFATLDEVTRGPGKVIPSSRTQVVQNLEGGIVSEILVREGDVVRKGDVLLRLDDTGAASSLAEKQTRLWALEADIVRLQAEIEGEKPSFPEELKAKAPDIVTQAQSMYAARGAEQNSKLKTLKSQVEQKKQEYLELKKRQEQAARSYELAKEELDLTAPLEVEGVVSKVELLRLRRQVNDLLGEKETTAIAVPRAKAAWEEMQSRLQEAKLKLKNEMLSELAKKKEEAQRIREILKAVEDEVDRTTVRAPMSGVVNRLLINTVGGVIKPGMDIVELIPLDDSLLVEARIRPKDIAFIRPGLPALVKISAYDYSVYGGLKGTVEHIGADTVNDEQGGTFYTIKVRTEKGYLGKQGNEMAIMPGMVASVEILTGRKTVMDYLLKPFNKLKENALTER